MSEKLLDETIKKQVSEFFGEMQHPVKLLFFGSHEQNCDYCEETRGLLEEISQLSDLITLETYDIENDKDTASLYNIEYAPVTVVAGVVDGETRNYNIRFAGIPAGHEFSSLINTIVMVSKQDSGLSPDIRKQLAALDHPVLLQVFVTPTCPYCPRAVILSHQMALESPFVVGEMVEAMEFPELSTRFGVSGVPHTVINSGDGEVVGAVPEANLMAEIERALAVAA
jgi:glutaredoxin-like protein